ncbi:MAG: Flp pilus assembly complex ATPase component TadA [Polyangiaceae bacterium]|nr:Flp pilus assembly complex ATPase component TadA [Polyangiaceae bacterium]MCW5791887.1 Flp pilus assembly complex ATPase component TadA [Polyangiaceae bacterium]
MAAPNPNSPTSFAIVISEKGGAERRQTFDRTEVRVGRVQGNELMLPKGNVSKRHAQLALRDGNFTITDLNSTNGTYVNRRRITQATVVRAGDRIYIGDFVLRIELADGAEDAPPASSSRSESSGDPLTPGREPIGVEESSGAFEPAVVSPEASAPEITGSSPGLSSPGERASVPPAPPPFPAAPLRSPHGTLLHHGGVPPAPSAHLAPPAPSARPAPPDLPSGPQSSSSSEAQELSSSDRSAPRPREWVLEAATLAHRAGLRALVQRVTDTIGAATLLEPFDDNQRQRMEPAFLMAVSTLRSQGALKELDEERLLGDARAELFGLGPLGPLLSDEDITEVHVLGHGQLVVESGAGRRAVEPPFSSEESLERAIVRLARLSGREALAAEVTLERQLPTGFKLRAVRGGLAGGRSLLTLKRPRCVTAVVDELVRRGTVSRAIATFLRHAVQGGANVLVVGARDARAADLLGALAQLSDAHWVVVAEGSELLPGDPRVTRLSLASDTADLQHIVSLVSDLSGTRLLVEDLNGPLAVAVLDRLVAGGSGLIASVTAGSLEQAFGRLTSQLMSHAGVPLAAARQQAAQAFDLVVEVARLRDQRTRVLRVAEPAGFAQGGELEELFTFTFQRTAAGGAVEGTFSATGVVPRVAQELIARGVPLDLGSFTRGQR